MKITNSKTGKKEEFIPIKTGEVKMYACGVTVYDLSHIGHARQAIVYAMITDYLRYRGYNVNYVRNYTDVDDKIINRANKLGKNALDFSKEQINETETDMENLHVTDADIKALASENIDNIIEFVQGLIDNGHAYVAETGDVYFDVRSFPKYGRLSNRKIDDMIDLVSLLHNKTTNSTASVKYGYTHTLLTPTRVGYTHSGWEVTSGTGTTVSNGVVTMGSSDSTVRAIWSINSYTLTIILV